MASLLGILGGVGRTASSELDERKQEEDQRRAEEERKRKERFDMLAKYMGMVDDPKALIDAFNGGDMESTILDGLKKKAQASSVASDFKSRLAQEPDVIAQDDMLSEALKNKTITPEQYAKFKAGLQQKAQAESKAGNARIGGLIKEPDRGKPPTVIDNLSPSLKPETVNVESINKQAKEMLTGKPTIEELSEIRKRLVKFNGGDVNHPTIKAIENRITQITEDRAFDTTRREQQIESADLTIQNKRDDLLGKNQTDDNADDPMTPQDAALEIWSATQDPMEIMESLDTIPNEAFKKAVLSELSRIRRDAQQQELGQ